MIYMSEAFYNELRDNYSGICLKCLSVKHGDTEPDAENYICDSCDQPRVQGIENLLMGGIIAIEEVDQPYARLKSGKIKEISF